MKNNWFIKTPKGQIVGPLSELQCRQGIEERPDLTEFFVRQGESAWQPAKTVLEMFQRLEREGLYIEQSGEILGPFTEKKFFEMVPSCDSNANWRKGNKGPWNPISPIKANPFNYVMQPASTQPPNVIPQVSVPVTTQAVLSQPHNQPPPIRPTVSAPSSLSTSIRTRKRKKSFLSKLATLLWFPVIASLFCGGAALFSLYNFENKPTKAEWREKLAARYGILAKMNVIANWEASDFKQHMGEPDRTQTFGDQAYWYYHCSDGTIQLSIYAPNLSFGIMQGDINDF